MSVTALSIPALLAATEAGIRASERDRLARYFAACGVCGRERHDGLELFTTAGEHDFQPRSGPAALVITEIGGAL